MNPKRALATAVLTGLATAGLALYAVTRVWRTVEHTRPKPLPPEVVTLTGGDLAAWAVPAAVVALAGSLALVAASGTARRVVAVLLGLAGAGVAAAGVTGFAEAAGIWPAVTVLAAVAVVLIAGWAVRDGAGWPAMSARYDRDAKRTPVPDAPEALWDALDRGEDPTSLSICQTAPGEECAR